ncbi:chaplin [Streptomyces sp. NBRC 109706]|uniref:chaplin n=1 Tax=Streptomyces sp. NBRC 109706 TaxID=1550035 RepID=UPI000781DC12|nr:chaplin [Streptomyces sp. NBRC 109706]
MRLRTAAAATAVACTVVLGAGSAAVASELPVQPQSSDKGHHKGDKHDKDDKKGKGGGHHGDTEIGAVGFAAGSPGVLSGNVIQVPISIPVNVCGNSINVIGLLNPAIGNTCVNK